MTEITKPGLYDIPEDVYHSDPAPKPSLSSSIAKKMLQQSPIHAWLKHPRLNPDHQPEHSHRFDIGKAAHTLLLEAGPKLVEINSDSYRTKAAQEQRDEARQLGCVPVLSKELRQVNEMVGSLRRQLRHHPDAEHFLAGGFSEESAFWQENGIWCHRRADRVSAERGFMFDYKTTSNAHPDTFMRQIVNLGYDVQAAHYIAGDRVLRGREPTFIFIVQELEPPYAVCVQTLTPVYLAIGEMKRQRALNLFKWCLEHNRWPSYPNSTVYIDPPVFERMKWMDENGDPLNSAKEDMDSLLATWTEAQAPLTTGDAA